MNEMKSSDADLSAKRQALAALLRRQEPVAAAAKRIPRRKESSPVPLAFAQERLWFLEQYYPGTSLYNIAAPYPLYGPLNVDVLRASLNDLVKRHESLRTTFISQDGKPLQFIAPELVLEVPLVDLSQFSENQRQQEAAKLMNEEGLKPFDLSRGPLLRATLLRISDTYHILVLVMHHIISDAWSMGVFMNEFTTIYTARSMNQTPVLPELPIQYADFAVWQREWMHGEGLQQQLAYWKQELEGIESDRLLIPTDRPRPQTLTFPGAVISAVFSPKVSARLRALTHATGITPYITLLTGFKVLNYRYTGQPAIVVGMPTANRNRTELERIIGFFVNTLVLRTRFSSDISFQEALSRVREVVLGAHAHQDLPFERLVEELQPVRSLDTNPLFQVIFDYQNQSPIAGGQGPQPFSEAATAAGDEDVQIVSITAGGTSKFDLTLSLAEVGQQFTCNVEYNTELFDHATIVRLIGHYHTLLAAAAADPARPIGDLPLLTPAERKQVLVDWNATQLEFPSEMCVHQQFEEWVERTPDAPAAVFESQQLSYRELNERANRLAYHLRRRGVGPEMTVGICLEASLEMVVGIFGVLKAGAAYLPLDASYPDDRLAFMLKDSGTRLILTQPHLAERVGRLGSFDVLPLTNDADQFADENKTNLPINTTSRNTCYVIYTSGSTGRPKGIMIEHRSLVNLVRALDVSFGLGPGGRTLQFASFSFDQSVREFFETLLSGATLCLASREKRMPGAPLLNLLRDMEISNLTLVPSVQAHLPHADLPSLRTLTSGGEACPQEIVNRWGVGRHYFNAYGPSEVTFASSVVECFPGGVKPTIGRPLGNVQYYAVDERIQPVPVGIPGELLVAGLGLARGYLGRPDLTAERFIPNPFSGEPGARLYRTGDLVRQLPDGQFDYVVRMDQQVKVRGFRIELGEIEAVLLEHKAVSAAAVGCYNETGEEQLAAYVVSGDVSIDELRSFLLQKLPEYMIPSVFIFLDHIPLTHAGKVDRNALPSPEAVRRQREHVAPRTPLEHVLAGIWSEVLGIEQISVHDNFFELGGHSLLITQIASRVRDTLHTEIPIRLIFESPTLAQLATSLSQDPKNGKKVESTADLLVRLNELPNEEIEHLLKQVSQGKKAGAAVMEGLADTGSAAEPQTTPAAPPASVDVQLKHMPPRSENGHPPLSFAQERLWILEQIQPGTTAYNVYRPIPFSGPLNIPALKRALDQLVQRHEVLRTSFQVVDGRPVQVIMPQIEVDLRIEDLQDLPAHERQTRGGHLLQTMVMSPFDLATGPLFRVQVLKFGPTENMIGLSIHHIVSDAPSVRILTRDLLEFYEHNVTGRPVSLPPLPIQAADFAIWQREQMQGETLEQHLSFWREQLADAPAVIDLPTDHPRPTVQSFRGDMEVFECPRGLSVTLEKLNLQEKVTMFMTMLAAYMALLHRYTGQTKIVVGAPISTRARAELENLVGFFTNTLVLPCNVSSRMTFRQLLQQVRRVTLAAYSHQDLPFERLVEELNPERSLNINPLFQVMLIVQKDTGVFAPVARAAREENSFQPDEITMAKFDLTLYIEETESGLVGGVEYVTELFERSTIRRMIDHFKSLLASIAANPDVSISDLRLITAAERETLLSQWGASPIPQIDNSVHAPVEKMVQQVPDAVAIIGEGQDLTYRALNERANQLAHYLIKTGLKPEDFVGVHMDRGPDLLMAILAILKAGAAYLPLDTSFPQERLSFMLHDAEAKVVLTESHLSAGLPNTNATVVQLDAAGEALNAESTENPPSRTLPEHAAYIIYTSGSTGTPKGIVMPHKVLAALISWHTNRPGFSKGRRTLQYSSLSFDVSLQEIFTAWWSGGAMVCISEEKRRDFVQVAQTISELKVERLFLPYVALRQLAEAAGQTATPLSFSLREVVTAGEQLKVTPAIKSFFADLADCRFYNQYGPAESHIVSDYPLDDSPESWEPLPPIGRPIAGARFYVLDRQQQLTPAGVVGELYIAEQIARCYLKRPDMTAEKFLPDPFANTPGERMYRTGDLVRHRPDGNLEFIGRRDQQLKIRGFRVELGEIEASLTKHPLVAEAIVVPTGQDTPDLSLVAYIVPATPDQKPEQLRDFLKKTLPDYMIPAQFVILEESPVTPTGKISRLNLPAVERTRPEMKQEFVAPRSPLEEQIAQIWSEVLGIPNPGIHDNFFELGGHSLSATQVVSLLRNEFSIEIPVRVIFEEPTIAGLSLSVVQTRAARASEGTLATMLDKLAQLSDAEIESLLSTEAGAVGD